MDGNEIGIQMSSNESLGAQISPYYRGVSICNSLPVSFQKENNKNVFKRNVKLYRFTQRPKKCVYVSSVLK